MSHLALVSPSFGSSLADASIPRFPLWDHLRAFYLHHRPRLVGADGTDVPELLVGDIRKLVERLSWALASSRFDHARLGDVRATWRAAVARATDVCRGRAWWHAYPDSPAFCADAEALARALAIVDARRAAITAVDGLPVLATAYADPRVLWDDLRYWFGLRRVVRRDQSSLLSYPVLTVRDVRHAAALLEAAGAVGLVARCAAVANDLPPNVSYPDSAGFWCRDAREACASTREAA